jgi:predicted MPP superfamily phosphohydrolase
MGARDPERPLRLWLYGLNLAVLALGLTWGAAGSRRAFFLVAFVPVALVPFSYARLRAHASLRRHLPPRSWAAPVLAALGVAGAVCDLLMLGQLLTARLPAPLPLLQAAGMSWVGAVWFSAHALFFLGATVGALARALGAVVARVLRPLGRRRPVSPPVQIERRLFLKQMGVMSVGAPFALSLSGVPLSYDFRVEEREVPLPRWPRELDGLRLVHLSDIHVGGEMNRERLLRVTELTNAARPDVVLHTGDFLTHRTGNFDLPLYEALARVRAPLGQWACLGNHDYDDAGRLVRRLRDAGVTTLRGEVSSLEVGGEELEIAGLDFTWERADRGPIYRRVIGGWSERRGPRLLLNHDPSGFAALPDGCADLVCSGHTHGGHIGVQLGRDRALTVVGLVGIPDQGLFERGDMRLFVTRCVGFYGYPMRLGIPPEIAVLVLRSA